MLSETPSTWRTLIASAFSDAKFYVPASAKEIEWAERDLGVAFPPELRQLLLETNGASAHYSAPLVWPVSEIVEQNKHFRTSTAFSKLYKPFTDETDGRTSYASDLRDYVQRTAAAVEPTSPPPRRSFFARIVAWLRRSTYHSH